MELELAGDPAMEQMFKRQNMLATYLVAQIKMLAQLATGRSYNCIEWLTRTFSYTMLVNLATNKYLPYSIVDGFTALVRILYLDRYPQLPNCGRAVLPEKLWIYMGSL